MDMQIKASSNSKTETSKRKPAAGHRCAFCLWQARAEDRYCGQCGEELQAIHNSSTTDGDIASPIAGAPACIKCGSAVNSQGTDCSICGLERGPRLYFQKLINRTNPSRLIKLTLLLSVILIAYIAGNQAEPAPVAQIDHSPHALPSETRLNKSIARIEQQIKLAGPGQGRRDLLDECLYLR
ncbi:MAG: hypothetical protein K8F91_00285, partial [Candidatus Obscuribacterales bacterium]|nr:hypothetical protein [Candidatus Obscuribacterales bacterium]